MDKKQFVEEELEKFISENPYADTFEIAQHFLTLGIANQKRFEGQYPKYYGD